MGADGFTRCFYGVSFAPITADLGGGVGMVGNKAANIWVLIIGIALFAVALLADTIGLGG
jgi:hypothetical protein